MSKPAIIMSDGRTFDTDYDYFRNLDGVIATAYYKVRAVEEQRTQDDMRYPLLNIRDWSWRTYERWKNKP